MGAERLAAGKSAAEALEAVADAARAATGADLAVVRVVADDEPTVRAVSGSPSLAAEIEGLGLADPAIRADEGDPEGGHSAAIAARVGARDVLTRFIRRDGSIVAALELYCVSDVFGREEREVAAVASAQVALVLRAFVDEGSEAEAPASLELAAAALAACAGGSRAAERIARLVVEATHAEACLLWIDAADGLRLVARGGLADAASAGLLADAASRSRESAALVQVGAQTAVSVPLGPLGVLQAVFAPEAVPSDAEVAVAGRVRSAGGPGAAHRRADGGDVPRARADA